MILVDSNVWIEFFSKKSSSTSLLFDDLLENRADEICLCDVILTEILQGISSEKKFTEVRNILEHFEIFPLDERDLFYQAAVIYAQCRTKGYTIRSTIDCLIAALALRNDLEIFTHDRDFLVLAKVFPLKLFQ